MRLSFARHNFVCIFVCLLLYIRFVFTAVFDLNKFCILTARDYIKNSYLTSVVGDNVFARGE